MGTTQIIYREKFNHQRKEKNFAKAFSYFLKSQLTQLSMLEEINDISQVVSFKYKFDIPRIKAN